LDLKKIGNINLTHENELDVIELDQMLKLTKIVYRTHSEAIRLTKTKFAEERKKLFLERNWVDYEKLVVSQKAEEDMILDRLFNEACDYCQIPQKILQDSASIYTSNPISLKQLVTAREQANFEVGKPPIDRDQTVKAFTDLRTEENRLICEQILEGRIEELNKA